MDVACVRARVPAQSKVYLQYPLYPKPLMCNLPPGRADLQYQTSNPPQPTLGITAPRGA